MELTKPDDLEESEKQDVSKDDSASKDEIEEYDTETTASEPPTPTVEDKPIISVNDGGTPNKKKRRKKSKKGKH